MVKTIANPLAEVRLHVEQAATLWKQADDTLKMAGVVACNATWEAFTSGLLVKRRSEDTPAECLTGTEYAEMFGVSKGLVSQWKRGGQAFALGIDPEEEAAIGFTRGRANLPHVTAVLDGKNPTAAKVRAAVKKGKVTPPADTDGAPATVEIPRTWAQSKVLIETILAKHVTSDARRAELAALVGPYLTAAETKGTTKSTGTVAKVA